MLLSYLKLSLRLLARNPFFTFINVLGLSIGFASFFGLWYYASSELKSDQYHPSYQQIIRLCTNWRWSEDGGNSWKTNVLGSFPPKVTQDIVREMPQVEAFTRILQQPKFEESLVGHGKEIIFSVEQTNSNNSIFKETKVIYADPNLFEFFSLPLIQGERKNILSLKNSIVLSERIAHKYFGSENPVGHFIILNGAVTLKITGIFQNLPSHTHLDFDMVISNVSKEHQWSKAIWPTGTSYFRLKTGTRLQDLEAKINSRTNVHWDELLKILPEGELSVFAQPLDEIAFSLDFNEDFFRPKSKTILITLAAVSVLILLIAWINYVNLTLARLPKRMKEMAARKVAGAIGFDFVRQHVIESALINFLAVAIAFTLLQLVRTPAEIFLRIVAPSGNFSWQSILFFTGLVLLGILVTGLYPVSIATRQSVHSLFEKHPQRKSSLAFLFTTFQYTIAFALLLWALIINFQLDHILTKAQGADSPIAIVESPVIRAQDFERQMEYLQERLLASRHVQSATLSFSVPGDDLDFSGLTVKRSVSADWVGLDSNGGVNENFLPFFGVKFLAGRNFQLNDRADVCIVSKHGVERLGFKSLEEALGAKVFIGDYGSKWVEFEIIGVIEDYRNKPYLSFVSSEENARGRGICLVYKNFLLPHFEPERLALKLSNQEPTVAKAEVEKIFNEVFPGNAFVYYFLDEHINRHYNNEKISRNQIVFFTFLSIGIASLGLLGMIYSKVAEKTKEIGIRKVLGAELHHIATLLLNTTVKQVTIAALTGIPVAYYLTTQYMEKFSERISLHWWHFALPIAILIVIMFATIASVLWKAAKSNAVEALKYE